MTDADVTLNPEQSSLLALIARWDGSTPITAGDLADRLGYEEIAVVRAIEALRGFGYVATEPNPTNPGQPEVITALTAAGRDRVSRV
ncbi:MarR family winged helix-turn-helix transcriptional regulator [Cumulibacter manganitolerans]|uniref:MarR family winged helix-turn-helix transcriptional regulator n=1 Tax=Cumulibacter manganitolerans TaxID=1884992 RepID=UPI001296CB36|nr:MarR family winged helix-turn-helix transcriptional regulator [Cumulibacter manganitolerans]